MSVDCLIDHHAFKQAVATNQVRALDYQFACFMYEQAQAHKELLFYSGLLLSQQLGSNHPCLPLARFAKIAWQAFEGAPSFTFPSVEAWQAALTQSGLANNSGTLPLCIDLNRLYLSRYHFYEKEVAKILQNLAAQEIEVNQAVLQASLQTLFEGDISEGINWQKVACALAAQRRLAVITGGPGTGKTTTVIRLLAALLQQVGENAPIIRLAAPTGKAAVRMSESIRRAKVSLNLADELKALIPEHASTLHRLLGVIPNSVEFRYNQQQRLALDVLVLDEASMVDLPMMYRLLRALPSHCRLIILGDKDQLSSVEAGNVLADICSSIGQSAQGHYVMSYSAPWLARLSAVTNLDLHEHEGELGAVASSICMLQKSWRFGGNIGQLAKYVNRCDVNASLDLLRVVHDDLRWVSSKLRKAVIDDAVANFTTHFANVSAAQTRVLNDFDAYRVLCAGRKGELGVEALNLAIEARLRELGFIEGDKEFYLGRPIMISSNDYRLGLFNGDVGIILPSSEAGNPLMACFIRPDGSVREIMPSRLPSHETAFAMTIHKSQGSEFTQVALVLPKLQGYESLLVKELVYTGITRAKKKITLFSSKESLQASVAKASARESGLAQRLHEF